MMWLKVGRTNNDPKVIAFYYLDYLSEIDGNFKLCNLATFDFNLKYGVINVRWLENVYMS
jgi:hypothetical protein